MLIFIGYIDIYWSYGAINAITDLLVSPINQKLPIRAQVIYKSTKWTNLQNVRTVRTVYLERSEFPKWNTNTV